MKRYTVREVFDTIQGEGGRAGCRSVFVRFAGCNLWNGRPEDRIRGQGACALWCDTDFAHGTATTTDDLLIKMAHLWPRPVVAPRWVVLSGGEPSLQVDDHLIDALTGAKWSLAMETNGRISNAALGRIEWLTISPKLSITGDYFRPKFTAATEVKVVLPGVDSRMGMPGWTEAQLHQLQVDVRAEFYYVQPMDPATGAGLEQTHLRSPTAGFLPQYNASMAACIAFVKRNPRWRLCLQTHKYAGLP